jgi:hypothetical protein
MLSFLTLLRPLYLAARHGGVTGSAILTGRLAALGTGYAPPRCARGDPGREGIPAYAVPLGQQAFIIGFAIACFAL